ncbi:rho GTPase-activating protein 26-like isoform X3 [Diadema antillarum]|uniref:rho GTPase-activating protein 26-like isoform X3 n=1 Tax=Diadema antillarum TaxID=105358 RepID=UPI003A8A59AF
MMVLSPLEFSECFLDSPEFREKLHAHEAELERTNKAIKELIRDGKALLAAARNLSKAQRAFSETLINFNFECIGTSQTDAEIDISQSLKEFGRLIASIEDERDRMLEHAKDQLIVPLEDFRKKEIGQAKEGKKDFERQTEKFCKSLDSYVSLSTRKKEASLQEADAALDMERRQFHKDSLNYVFRMQEVQEKKKFEFVETLLGFMYSWLTFYHQGHDVSQEFKPYMTELQLKLQNIRAGFDSTRQEAENLMHKMMEKPYENKKNSALQEGYLFLYEKRALGSSWIKQYCRYDKDKKKLLMQQYVQTLPKVTSEEIVTVLSCTRRMTESIEKRFCFDITVQERSNILTLQAVTEEERTQWMRSMGGKEPVYLNPAHISSSDENLLNDIGFHFIRKCIEAIESRGLDDQGLYRVVGVNSKVQRLTSLCLDKRKPQNVNLSDSGEWEIKTITSALKNYFRNLPEPLMTYRLHEQLMQAAKQESKTLRVNDIHGVIHQLPEPNLEMLDLIIGHLNKVASNCEKNLMTVANLGVCFGPTLMRPEEETMKAIMDIKFSNIIVEILIQNYHKIFKTAPDGIPPQFQTRPSTSNFPNSTTSSISSSSSASSSRASPRHAKATPNSTPKDQKSEKYLTQTDSVGSSVAREHSPRRPGVRLFRRTVKSTPPALSVSSAARSPIHETKPGVEAQYSSSSSHESISSQSSLSTHSSNSSPPSSKKANSLSTGKSPPQSLDEDRSSPLRTYRSPSEIPRAGPTRPPLARADEVRSTDPSASNVPGAEATSIYDTPGKKGICVRTLYACDADNESELSFQPNQIIVNVRSSKERGWLLGTLNGKTGLIPENYVQSLQ